MKEIFLKVYLVKGKIRGIPDGTGPYGRGAGPGKGRKDCSGLRASKKKIRKHLRS